MKPKSEPAVSLTIGSRYLIRSVGSRDEMIETRGVFKGVVSVGTIDALTLELEGEGDEKGRLRVIPSHMVLAIDILEVAEREETVKDESHIHYT